MGCSVEWFKDMYRQFKAEVSDYFDAYVPEGSTLHPLVADVCGVCSVDFFATPDSTDSMIPYPTVSVLKGDYYPTNPRVNFIFEYGPTTDEAVEDLKIFASKLALNGRSGLLALMRYADEPKKEYKRQDFYKDGLAYGTEGNYSSQLYVENGSLFYDLKSCCVGFWGEAHFELGDASKGRVALICRIVENFENSFETLVYVTKHRYIDNIDLYTDEDEEE